MALRQIELPELSSILLNVVEGVSRERHVTGQIFQLMYNTGLRSGEVLDTWRWEMIEDDRFKVQLSKREGVRFIDLSAVPPGLLVYYISQLPFTFETYSSINNTFKHHAPGIIFEDRKRRTTIHALRYRYIKQLRANGLSIEEIAQHMGHKVMASAQGYVLAQIWLGS